MKVLLLFFPACTHSCKRSGRLLAQSHSGILHPGGREGPGPQNSLRVQHLIFTHALIIALASLLVNFLLLNRVSCSPIIILPPPVWGLNLLKLFWLRF